MERMRRLALETKCIEVYNCVTYKKNVRNKNRWEQVR